MPLQLHNQPQTWELLEAITDSDRDEKLKEFAKNPIRSVLSAIACPCVVRYWAKHSQIKAIAKFINFSGNAMPLQIYDINLTFKVSFPYDFEMV